jgi:AraC family transcriptional regulator
MNVAILEDYQNVAPQTVDWSGARRCHGGITVFNDHIAAPSAVVERFVAVRRAVGHARTQAAHTGDSATANTMTQGSLRTNSSGEWVDIRTAQTDSVRIEFLHCRTQAKVRWNVVPSELSIILARNRAGEICISMDGDNAKCLRAGKTGFWFFPEGMDREGELTADSAYDCAGVFIKPSFLPTLTKQALSVPLVGACNNMLGQAFNTLAGELARSNCVLPLFTEGWTMQALAHVVRATNEWHPTRALRRSGLAPWQLRRAKEMLRMDLASKASPRRLADACKLSVSHFSRAFKTSTGISPHEWLVGLRVETAQSLLENSWVPLVEIAALCGFADQSHFSRVFARIWGKSPGAWRREHWRQSPASSATMLSSLESRQRLDQMLA